MTSRLHVEHILLVDDEPSVVFALRLLLQAIGFKVADFSDPYAAIEFIRQGQRTDLCICDLRMPNLDGLQVLEEIRKIKKDLPFVLMSAHATDEEADKAAQLGSSGFLSKPFTPEDLKDLIAKLEKK